MSRLRMVPPPDLRLYCEVCDILLTSPAHGPLCLQCWHWCQLGAALATAARWFQEEQR